MESEGEEYYPTEQEVKDELATDFYLAWRYEGWEGNLRPYLENAGWEIDLEALLEISIECFFTDCISLLAEFGANIGHNGIFKNNHLIHENPLKYAIDRYEAAPDWRKDAFLSIVVEVIKYGGDSYWIKPNPLNEFIMLIDQNILGILIRNGADLSDLSPLAEAMFLTEIGEEKKRRNMRLGKTFGFHNK